MDNQHVMTKLEWHSNFFRMPIEKCEAAFCSLAANGHNKLLLFNVEDLMKSKNVKKSYCYNGEYTSFFQNLSISWRHVNDIGCLMRIKQGEHVLYEIPNSLKQIACVAYIKTDV